MSTKAFLSLVASLVLGACTKPNPKNCGDGSCTDPAFPFCDVDGSVGGEANTCIAVTCTADQFVACRDDLAITCNAQGNNYDEIKCDKGCDPTVGCRVCDPNQTVCADGKLQSCDANGVVTSSETCALGCFADQPRCRDIDPSNGLAMYLDMVSAAPNLNLANATIKTTTGEITDNGVPVSVPSFLVNAPTGGAAIRVFVANTVTIQNAVVDGGTSPGPAMALVANDVVSVVGTLRVLNSAGGMIIDGCTGGFGTAEAGGDTSGGGGGAFATAGAPGGSSSFVGGTAGAPTGTANLVPLRGGCPGGFNNDPSNGQPVTTLDSGGGGAIQISSRTSIEILGTIDVKGARGYADTLGQFFVVGGGNAGGGALLEAPQVTVGPAGQILASGGDGAAACVAATVHCGLGGAGATSGLPASTGMSITQPGESGGGGGGLGRIRINTPNQTFTQANTSVTDGALTVGTLSTR